MAWTVLKAAKEPHRAPSCSSITAYASTETAVEAMKLGAYDYVTKPFELDELRGRRRQRAGAAPPRRRRISRSSGSCIASAASRTSSAAARRCRTCSRPSARRADSGSTVLITGESGTGKELVAQALHCGASRRDGPFVAVNCGAVPETLMESRAVRPRQGRLHRRGGDAPRACSRRPTAARCSSTRSARCRTTVQVEAPAGAPGARDPPRRRHPRRRGRRPHHRRHQPRPGAAPSATACFREDLFYRLNVIPHPPAAAARAARGHSPARRPLHREAVGRGAADPCGA